MENDVYDNQSTRPGRVVYLDYLRVFAILAVIVIHVSAQNWYAVDMRSADWQIFNIYDSIARWAVPLFVMVSGSLFLGRRLEMEQIYFKYILRLATAFICWAGVYAIVAGGGKKQIILNTIAGGKDHMWFIPMMIGLYICIPIIQKITESEGITRYFLIISAVFSFLLPQIVTMVSDFGSELFKEVAWAFDADLVSMEFFFVRGYPFYFVLGYYLYHTRLDKKCRYIVYGFGALGFLLTILLTSLASIKMQEPTGRYYDYFALNVLLESVAVFIWFQYHRFEKTSINGIMEKLSKYSFGAYLVHFLIIQLLEQKVGVNTLSIQPIVSVPLISCIVFLASFSISFVLNHVPFLKRYIV